MAAQYLPFLVGQAENHRTYPNSPWLLFFMLAALITVSLVEEIPDIANSE